MRKGRQKAFERILCAVDDVLAGHASHVRAGAADPSLFDHSNAIALPRDRPCKELGAFAATENDEVVVFNVAM